MRWLLTLAACLMGLGCAMTAPELRAKGHHLSVENHLPIDVAAEYLRAFESLGCGEFPSSGLAGTYLRSDSVLWVVVHAVFPHGVSDKTGILYEITPSSATAYCRFESTEPRVRYSLDRISKGVPAVCEPPK